MDEMQVYDPARKYTYEDYENRDDEVRFELIDGIIYMMATPARMHQQISGELYLQMANFLKGKPCRVYYAPFSVRLSVGEGADTVLEPDLVIICDMTKLDDRGCKGAPEMVVEILSPSTSKKDRTLKFKKYEQAGVKELWFVDPVDKTVAINILKDGEYVVKFHDDSETVHVHVLDGCFINLTEVFAE